MQIDEHPITSLAYEDWRIIHAELRAIHARRTADDAKEARYLRCAEEIQLHVRLGYPTFAAFLMAELGYSRHAANERIRVAHELLELPAIEEALRAGDICWSIARELTRVATADTEDDWLDAIAGKAAHQVARLVKGFRKGARPGDARDPAIVTEWVGLEVTAARAARWRQMKTALDEQAGRHLTDDELLDELLGRAMGSADNTAPAFHTALAKCTACKRVHQHAAGEAIEVPAALWDRARCTGVDIGNLDLDACEPKRTAVPASKQRKVLMRDLYMCQAPGCRSRRHLEVHHIVHREHGGGNQLWNLITLCSGCHDRHHEGTLRVSGRAPDRLVFERPEPDAVPRGPCEPDSAN